MNLKRITVFTPCRFERELYRKAVEVGVLSYVCLRSDGNSTQADLGPAQLPLVEVELLAHAESADELIVYCRDSRGHPHPLTVTVDHVIAPSAEGSVPN
jgi:hypothetical protein